MAYNMKNIRIGYAISLSTPPMPRGVWTLGTNKARAARETAPMAKPKGLYTPPRLIPIIITATAPRRNVMSAETPWGSP